MCIHIGFIFRYSTPTGIHRIVEDRIYPVTHMYIYANHEVLKTSTNVRKSPTSFMVSTLVDVRELHDDARTRPGNKGSSTRTTRCSHCVPVRSTSLLARREGGFMEAPPCHTRGKRRSVKASPKACVQDLDKADIIGGGDLHSIYIMHIQTVY